MENKIYSYELIKDFLDGDPDDIKDIMETFINLAPEMVSDIKKRLDEEDWEKLSKAAHKIKSSIRLWKMDESFEAALFIEKNAVKTKDKELMNSKFEKIKSDLDLCLEQMQEDLNNWDKISEKIQNIFIFADYHPLLIKLFAFK